MWLLLQVAAWACPPTAGEVERARALFDDAETEQARGVLDAAMADLACQSSIVDRDVLKELFRLDGLVALSRLDNKAAVYATIRAVAVDPESPPPPGYGPELAELFGTWSERLKPSVASMGVEGGGRVFIDGRPISHGGTREVIQGEHLVQIERGAELESIIVDVVADQVIETGLPAPSISTQPVPIGPKPPSLDPVERPARQRRHRPAGLWVVGGTLLAAGGAAVGWAAYQDEVVFPNRSFNDAAEIDRAANSIRIAYGTGYGVAGVGVGLVVTNLVGFRKKRAESAVAEPDPSR